MNELKKTRKFDRISQLLKRPLIIYTIVGLLILLPILVPGYIFALDMVFAPHIHMPEYVSSSYPFYALLHILNIFVPSQVLQKALLLIILVLSGYGMHKLICHMQGDKMPKTTYASWGLYAGGLLYMINPFTYSRFMVGQFAVLLGYALLPVFIRALCLFGERPTRRTAFTLAAWAVAIGVVSIHTAGMLILFSLIAVPLLAYRYGGDVGHLRRLLRYGVLAVAAAIIASSYWLVPLAVGDSTTARAISGFTTGDQQAFETVGSGVSGKIASVVQLQGFWADARDMYALPQDRSLFVWVVMVLVLWALVAIGVIALARRRQYELFLLGIAALVAIPLACTGVMNSLAMHIPLFAGYREPQKFVAVLAVAFAAFAGYGAVALISRLSTRGYETAAGISALAAVALPALLTPTMLWGFSGQLQAHNYPPDWTSVNEQLNTDRSATRALFLPWHQYMSFGFTGRIVVNPAAHFFDKPTLVNNELEFGGASPTVPNSEKATLGAYLDQAAAGDNRLATRLAARNIKYVMLAKENDYRQYDYLDSLPDFEVIQDTPTLRLYRNMAHGRPHEP